MAVQRVDRMGPPRGGSASNPSGRFAAIDFETADNGRDSACALAVVIVEGNRIVEEDYFLIRPPRQDFLFTYIHGITWEDVVGKPVFGEMWPRIEQLLTGVDFIAAHNASFDRSVLYQCCEAARVVRPAHDFHCTVKLARHAWDLKPARLPDVCRHLQIPLQHHQADSDARACAQIIIAAREQRIALPPCLNKYRGQAIG